MSSCDQVFLWEEFLPDSLTGSFPGPDLNRSTDSKKGNENHRNSGDTGMGWYIFGIGLG